MTSHLHFKSFFLIDREDKTDIIPVPAIFGTFIVFFLAVFFKIVNCETVKLAKFQRFFLFQIKQLLADLWYNMVAHTISTTPRKEL